MIEPLMSHNGQADEQAHMTDTIHKVWEAVKQGNGFAPGTHLSMVVKAYVHRAISAEHELESYKTGRRRCQIPAHRQQIRGMQSTMKAWQMTADGDYQRGRVRELEKAALQRDVADLKRELLVKTDLLKRIFDWDHMDTAADGKYWRRQILDTVAPVGVVSADDIAWAQSVIKP